MLILILINVHYLQNIVFSFQEDSNGQNYSLSNCHHPRFATLLLGGFSPLKNTGDRSIYISPKLQRVEIFSSESTSYLKLKAEKFLMLAKRKEDLHFLNFNGLFEVVLALGQLSPSIKRDHNMFFFI